MRFIEIPSLGNVRTYWVNVSHIILVTEVMDEHSTHKFNTQVRLHDMTITTSLSVYEILEMINS